MNIVVMVKQVPDMEKVKFDREKGVIDRKSAGTEVNPFDLNALEVAVDIVEKIGGDITAISMGPATASEALREAIARGAHKGILLSDRKFGGADVKATSKTLAAGIQKIGNVDLVIAGLQTVDGDTGQVGSEVACMLDIPSVCSVNKIIDIKEDRIVVSTDMWDSTYIKEVRYPALITVTKEANNPRMPSFKGKMNARKAEITVWDAEMLSEFIDDESIGIKGSATVVKKIEVPKLPEREGKLYRGNLSEGLAELKNKLVELKILEVNHE